MTALQTNVLPRISFDASATQSTNNRPMVDVGAVTLSTCLTSTPASNVQATVTASAVAGKRNVATTIAATLSAGSTAITAAAPLLVNLRDGVSGTGTVLWSTYINVPAVASTSTTITLPCNIAGSTGNAMTLEFAAAGGANYSEK